VSETIFGAGDNICCVETFFDDIKSSMPNRAYSINCFCKSMIFASSLLLQFRSTSEIQMLMGRNRRLWLRPGMADVACELTTQSRQLSVALAFTGASYSAATKPRTREAAMAP
jgi:hypothetical protein